MFRSIKARTLWLPCLATAVALGAPGNASAVTHRTANVVVQNSSGKPIEWVTVIHKYSTNYTNPQTWGNLPNNMRTKQPMRVDYNTGFMTTGVDWWMVTWKFVGDPRIHRTNPLSFREAFDFLEGEAIKNAPKAGQALGGAIAGNAGSSVGGPVADAAVGLVLNSGSTVGFKQHILRSEDEGRDTVIEIRNGEVRFVSNSGISTTSVPRW